MPWLTPDTLPETDVCRSLFIPDDPVWLALVSGALTELTQTWNWEKFGDLTVAETIAAMQEMIGLYYSTGCAGCYTSGGYRVVRISSGGRLQQLNSDGNWEEATDEYAIPEPDPRTGGTPPDQICLAAKNAVNVLQKLYENLSDSFNMGLDEAEAETALALAVTGLVGFEFAPITFAISAFFAAVFTALYGALEFIIADLWDDDVSAQITCFLIACAVNTSGVVTFDWDCFIGKLNSLLNEFSLTETQLRLYAQIGYILYFIGGVGGLNLAARTTEITDDSCNSCVWCFTIDFTLTDGLIEGIVPIQSTSPDNTTWVSGTGWVGGLVNSVNKNDLSVDFVFPSDTYISSIEWVYDKSAGSGSNNLTVGRATHPHTNYFTTQIAVNTANPTGTNITKTLTVGAVTSGCYLGVDSGASSATVVLKKVTLRGTGVNPFGSDNCP